MRQFIKSALQSAPQWFHESLLNKAIGIAGVTARFRSGQPTMWGSLDNLAKIGFRPGGILDVGAHYGQWARQVSRIFPGVPIHMIEAQPNLEPRLRSAGFPYSIALLGPENRETVPLFVNPEGLSSGSVMPETTGLATTRLTLPMCKLDELGISLPPPLLLKLDVQGYELEVLAGASETLKRTEVILSEVALLEYNAGAPLMHEVMAFMAGRGFVPYDICEGTRRHDDLALFQLDMLFVRSDSSLRARRRFWPHQTEKP